MGKGRMLNENEERNKIPEFVIREDGYLLHGYGTDG